MGNDRHAREYLAGEVLRQRLGISPELAANIVNAFDDEELEAIRRLPAVDELSPILTMAILAARIRQAAEPLVLSAVNFAEALEAIGTEGRTLSRFSTAGGKGLTPGQSAECIGPRPADVRRDPRHGTITRAIGDE